MLWFLFSFFCAIIASFLDILTKKISIYLNPFKIAAGRIYIAAFLILIYFLFFKKNFIDLRNIKYIVMIIPLEMLALYLYIKSISYWALSHTIPLLSLSPFFLFFFSKLFLFEKLSEHGICGVFLIVTGSYILNISSYKEGVFAPFKALFKEKGARLMLIVALIYSFDSAIGKKCIEISSVDSFLFNYFFLISIGFLILNIIIKNFLKLKELIKLIPLGFLTFLLGIFQFTAYSLAPVVYVISIKRMSILFSVLSGKIFFKEKRILEKVFGSILMIIGSIFIGIN